jgi:hypothetical protein
MNEGKFDRWSENMRLQGQETVSGIRTGKVDGRRCGRRCCGSKTSESSECRETKGRKSHLDDFGYAGLDEWMNRRW